MTSRKRILFVDDEAAILASLSNLLRKDRHRWDLVFANGGPEAARLVAEAPFDVIVTDMRMPDLDGAQLLELVKKQSPRTVRIMLSGHAESEGVLRALPLVHQFISKPCDIKTLRGLIERCCTDTCLDPERSVTAVTGAVPGLPSHPALYDELCTAAIKPACTASQLAAIVERDPAMAAKLLQIANTSYFGTGEAVMSIRTAVATIGVEMIRELIRTQLIFPAATLARGFSLDELCESSLRCAQSVRRAVSDPKLADEAYAVGLLHDIGRLVLAFELKDRYADVLALAQSTGRPLYEVEQAQLGVTHGDVGAHLFAMWALPVPLIEAIANHHAPRSLPGTAHPLVTALQATAN
jgi:HD-like signal output (HDOD) protein/ActR/RegA family two-component response regulator